jgi:hypothetical protein
MANYRCTYPLFRMHVHLFLILYLFIRVVLTHYSECMFIKQAILNTSPMVVLTHYSECMFIEVLQEYEHYLVVLTHYS